MGAVISRWFGPSQPTPEQVNAIINAYESQQQAAKGDAIPAGGKKNKKKKKKR